MAPSVIDPEKVETNIVGLQLNEIDMTSQQLAEAAKKESVLVSALGPKYARLVTHLDVSDSNVRVAAEVLASILKNRRN